MNRLNWLQFWLKKNPEDSSMRVNKKKPEDFGGAFACQLHKSEWTFSRQMAIYALLSDTCTFEFVGFGIDVFNRLSISLGKLRVAPTLRCRSRKGDLIWDPNRCGNYKLDTEWNRLSIWNENVS